VAWDVCLLLDLELSQVIQIFHSFGWRSTSLHRLLALLDLELSQVIQIFHSFGWRSTSLHRLPRTACVAWLAKAARGLGIKQGVGSGADPMFAVLAREAGIAFTHC